MPGVNLHFRPASATPEALCDTDTAACAESGMEEVIGDLLIQEELQEEQLWKRRLELALRSAVCEVHCDLQAFGKRVDARLQEAATQVASLATVLAQLQEENLMLRSQHEALVRRVDALSRAMGAQELLLLHGPDGESSTSDPRDPQTEDPVPAPKPSRPQDSAAPPGRPRDVESSTAVKEPSLLVQGLDPGDPQTEDPVPDSPLSRPQDPAAPPAHPHDAEDLDMTSTVVEELSLLLQDFDPRDPQTGDQVPEYPLNRRQDTAGDPPGCPKGAEAPPALDVSFTEPFLCLQDSDPLPPPPPSVDAVVPHPPTFATCRSLSAPSLMTNIPADDDMVLAALR